MITVTPDAARQIRVAATRSDADGLALRIAARRDAEGALHYAMGFDDARPDDIALECEGVAIVVHPDERALLTGMTLDYVEYEQGDFRFIFINPNDRPGMDSAARKAGCGSGGCGCGSNQATGGNDGDRATH